jgi:HTH-type transcriptional regulator/antitoxin HigA
MSRPGQGYVPPIPIPPGETIREVLQEKYLTQVELAQRLEMTTKHVNEIISGKAPITADTAVKLEDILGLPTSYWLNLEAIYQESLIRLRDRETQEEIEIAKAIPYSQLTKYGLVSNTRKTKERIQSLRKFFEVPSLKLIPEIHSVAFRAKEGDANPYALAAWLQWGISESRKIETEPYNRTLLIQSIPYFRQLTLLPAQEFVPLLKERCSQCGIALVFAPHLKKTYAHGATKWLSPDKVLVLLSLRYKFADIFWFSFFHEISHVLWHQKKQIYVNLDTKIDDIERDADRRAAEMLLPEKEFSKFISEKYVFTAEIVKEFASEQGVDPSIVAGRLQHDGHIKFSELTELKRRFDWAH